jgi:multiple sugar transport system permease protein
MPATRTGVEIRTGEIRRRATWPGVFDVARVVIIGLAVIAVIIPLLWTLSLTLKSEGDYLASPVRLLPSQLYLENYQTALFSADSGVLKYLANSLMVAAGTTALAVFTGSLTAYSLTRLRMPFRLSTIVALLFLMVQFYPKISLIVPYFVIMRDLRLLDTPIAVILAHTGLALPVVIWLMMTFFNTLPHELEESAMIDGSGPWSRFTRVVLPIAAPGVATAAILTTITSWNEFLLAASVTTNNAKTLPIAVASYITEKGTLFGPLATLATVTMVPVVLFALFAQKYLIAGITQGAIKE